jgi:hypothetical protein
MAITAGKDQRQKYTFTSGQPSCAYICISYLICLVVMNGRMSYDSVQSRLPASAGQDFMAYLPMQLAEL